MMDFNTLKDLDNTYIANTYSRVNIDIQSGSGASCISAEGKEYIDFSSGIGVNALGFTNTAWVDAVSAQLGKLGHISNLYYSQPQALLAQALCAKTNMQRVFFSNSGAEANEGAIKTARKYGEMKYGSHRHEIITLVNSFHGRTIATLAATGQDVFHKHFGPFPAGFLYAKANDIADLNAKISDNTAAIMIECIQGEGGIIPLDKEYIQAVAQICAEKDILLIIDEVQSGVGRTGKFLCCEYFDIKPDVVTLAKGLGGGLPIGAVLFGEKTKDTLVFGDHATTFGGNPIVASGALAVLDSIDDEFLASVIETGEYITQKLLTINGVEGVDGRGLMLGARINSSLKSAEIVAACAEKGLIILTAKEKLRLLPPLTITKPEIDKGINILSEVITAKLS